MRREALIFRLKPNQGAAKRVRRALPPCSVLSTGIRTASRGPPLPNSSVLFSPGYPLPSYISCVGHLCSPLHLLSHGALSNQHTTHFAAHFSLFALSIGRRSTFSDACCPAKMSKNVKFSENSDTSGSRTSSHVSSHASSHASQKSSRGHRRSDSESLSDYESRGSVPDGAFSSADYAQQQLRKALHAACAERDRWKGKAQELGEGLAATRKELTQTEARWRGIVERNEVIEQEKKRMHSEKKAAQEDNKNLLDENAKLRERLEKLEKKLSRANGSPPSSSVNLNSPGKPKVHRSNSRSQRDATRERPLSQAEQVEKDKARLSKRFERSDESSDSRSDSTSKTEGRRRRESTTIYIEPMGPPSARPAAPISPTSRHYPTYTTSPVYSPQYSNLSEPVMSPVPRSVRPSSKHPAAIHPSVLVQSPPLYQESPFHPDEDGGYFPHPIPRGRGR